MPSFWLLWIAFLTDAISDLMVILEVQNVKNSFREPFRFVCLIMFRNHLQSTGSSHYFNFVYFLTKIVSTKSERYSCGKRMGGKCASFLPNACDKSCFLCPFCSFIRAGMLKCGYCQLLSAHTVCHGALSNSFQTISSVR